MSIKIKVNSESGIIVTGLKNPNPVQISEELNGLTDDTVVSSTMQDDYFAYNSTIELDPKALNAKIVLKLITLECFGMIIRVGAEYPSGTTEVAKGFFVPQQDAKNNQAIEKFWMGKLPGKDPLIEFKEDQDQII